MSKSDVQLWDALLRIVVVIVVVARAKSRDRAAWPWGIFAFVLPWPALIAIWFVPRKKPKDQPAPATPSSQSTSSHPTTPTLPGRPADLPTFSPPPAAVATPFTVTELKRIEGRNHSLVVKKASGSASGQAVLLVAVAMPTEEYFELVSRLGYGGIAEERAAILAFVRKVFSRPEHDGQTFASEAEYVSYLKKHCPELKPDAENEWFKTVAFHFPAYHSSLERHILAYIDRQSSAYTQLPSSPSPTQSILQPAPAPLPPKPASATPTSPPKPTNPKVSRPLPEPAPQLPTPKPIVSAPVVADVAKTEVAPPKAAEERPRRTDWAAFQQVLTAKNISKLYHFTDRANLDSIISNEGLMSWYSCQQKGVTIPRPGGSDLSWQLDSNKGLQDYVRLSFVRDHPMGSVAKKDGRISDLVILEIDPEVIFWQETKFSTQNAAKSGVTATNTLEKLSSVKFEVFRRKYFDLDAGDKGYYQAEVLVHQFVPLKYITNLNQVRALA